MHLLSKIHRGKPLLVLGGHLDQIWDCHRMPSVSKNKLSITIRKNHTCFWQFCQWKFWIAALLWSDASAGTQHIHTLANNIKQYYSLPVPLQACLDSHKFAWIPQNHHIGSMRVEVRPRNVKLWNKFPCSAKYQLRWLPTSCLIGRQCARMDLHLIWPIPPYGSTIPFPHGDLYKPWKSRQNVRCIEIRMHFMVAPDGLEIRMHFMVAPDGLESKATENHRKPVRRCAKKNHVPHV